MCHLSGPTTDPSKALAAGLLGRTTVRTSSSLERVAVKASSPPLPTPWASTFIWNSAFLAQAPPCRGLLSEGSWLRHFFPFWFSTFLLLGLLSLGPNPQVPRLRSPIWSLWEWAILPTCATPPRTPPLPRIPTQGHSLGMNRSLGSKQLFYIFCLYCCSKWIKA